MVGRIGDPLRQEVGVTLTELVVTLALFGMIMIGVVLIWTKAQEAYFVGSETAEVQENVRAAIDFMIRELRATGRDATICAFDYTGPGSLDCTTDKRSQCTIRLNNNTPANGTYYGGVGGCNSVFAVPVGTVAGVTVPTDQAIAVRADLNDNGTIAKSGASPADPGSEEVVYTYSTSSCPTGIPACITRDDGSGPQAMVAVDIATAASPSCTHEGFCLTYYPRPGYSASCPTGSAFCTTPFTLPLTQADADNIGRIHIQVKALQQAAGSTVSRTLVTDVYLRNRKQ